MIKSLNSDKQKQLKATKKTKNQILSELSLKNLIFSIYFSFAIADSIAKYIMNNQKLAQERFSQTLYANLSIDAYLICQLGQREC
ncbi:MAG: hypothetical protein IGR93_04450 [Hydrococcus sp. C42_A2020_068]|uniref:hypothetical protein n=1 Tax=Pleurocapsa sp. PCC 7327 TaxID=118163 RepID=UPI00029FDF31|nr:hypothetical protein [Pleurocapsa sp. PCC 7327]AFY77126.1 hypothetical protein Ple7327_1773 [Pleurocapsa sp. PCC 7327]MBF2019369.1 hypothetical protein [Hydrococcus sp. C42_A2020_068]